MSSKGPALFLADRQQGCSALPVFKRAEEHSVWAAPTWPGGAVTTGEMLPAIPVSMDTTASFCFPNFTFPKPLQPAAARIKDRLSSLPCNGGSYSKPWLWRAVKQIHTNITLPKARENKYKQDNEKLAAAASYSPLAVSAIGTGDEITNKDLLQRRWNRQESLEVVTTLLPPAQRAAVLFLQPSTAAGRSTWMCGIHRVWGSRAAWCWHLLVMEAKDWGLKKTEAGWGAGKWEAVSQGDGANERTRGGSERNKTER